MRMVRMYLKNIIVALVVLFCLASVVFSGVIQNSVAQTNGAKLSIVDHSYVLTNREKRGTNVASWYIITIVIHNAGLERSEDTIVALRDQEMVDPNTKQPFLLYQNFTVDPNQNATIVFNWTTVKYLNQKINISYYPTVLNYPKNKYDSGSLEFVVNVVEAKAKSTPGFELVLFFAGFLCIVLFRRYRNR